MPSTPSPAAVSRACAVGLLALLALTGCLGGTGGSSGPAVSDDAARERALAAEERYLRSRLGNAPCVDGWGLNSYTGVDAESTVVNRTDAGVHVDVVHPFWYGTAETDADGRSEATYLVTADGVRRLRGTEVSPC
jgi:hypothetical protein